MKARMESGMEFGDFPDAYFFQIENSRLHKSVGEGIKTVEFILGDETDRVIFVEAKTTCPNAANRDKTEERSKKYEEYYLDIADKFADSFQMFLSAVLKRNKNTDEMGTKLREKQDYSETVFCFVLVIKNAKDLEWLVGPKNELERRLLRMQKIWKIRILVLNEETAREYGIVKSSKKER